MSKENDFFNKLEEALNILKTKEEKEGEKEEEEEEEKEEEKEENMEDLLKKSFVDLFKKSLEENTEKANRISREIFNIFRREHLDFQITLFILTLLIESTSKNLDMEVEEYFEYLKATRDLFSQCFIEININKKKK